MMFFVFLNKQRTWHWGLCQIPKTRAPLKSHHIALTFNQQKWGNPLKKRQRAIEYYRWIIPNNVREFPFKYKLSPCTGNWVLFIQSTAVCTWSLCWCVCLLFLMPTLPTTWQGAARARPTTQTWCGIKQLNRTKPANQKETNGHTQDLGI